MAWNTGNSYVGGTAVTAALINGIGNDFRTWGGNVDGGGYQLTNCSGVYINGGYQITTNQIGLTSGNTLSLTTTANQLVLGITAALRSGSGDVIQIQGLSSYGVTAGDSRAGTLLWYREPDVTSGKITSNFYIYINNDGTLTQALQLDQNGWATITGGAQLMGGDLYLLRTNNAYAYITRPNTPGYKNIAFATTVGGNLDNIDFVTSSISITNLPSTNPGGGSKQIWYDPSDGNRIKYAA